MSQVRIPALSNGTASIRLVHATTHNDVLGFEGDEWATAYELLRLDTEQFIELTPTADIALAGGGVTAYAFRVFAPKERLALSYIQVPESSVPLELRALIGASEPEPGSTLLAELIADMGEAVASCEADSLTATTQSGIATDAAESALAEAGIATVQAGIATVQAGSSLTQAGIATSSANSALLSSETATSAAQTATQQGGVALTQAGIATGAASNAIDAAESANNARTQTGLDRTQTGLDRIATGLDRTQTGLDSVNTSGDRTQTGLDRTQTGLDRTQTGLDRTQTGLDQASAAESAAAIELNLTSLVMLTAIDDISVTLLVGAGVVIEEGTTPYDNITLALEIG
jgi:hypothetical protein